MAANSLLARIGLRLATLGSAASLAIAAPIAEGNVSPDAQTHAARTGWYFPTATSIGAVTNGTERMRIYADGGVQFGGTYSASPGAGWALAAGGFVAPDGSVTNPTYVFASSLTTGLCSSSANSMQAVTSGALRQTWTTSRTETYVPLYTAASSTSAAGFRMPHGTAPSSPGNGDLWTTTSGYFLRLNGVTNTIPVTTAAVASQVAFFSSTTAISSSSTITAVTQAAQRTLVLTMAPSGAGGAATCTALTSSVTTEMTSGTGAEARGGRFVAGVASTGGVADVICIGATAESRVLRLASHPTALGTLAQSIGIRGAHYGNFALSAGTVTITDAAAVYGEIELASSDLAGGTLAYGTLAAVKGVGTQIGGNGITTVVGLYGVYLPGFSLRGSTTTINTFYGVYIGANTVFSGSPVVSNSYGVYQADANSQNYFAGHVYVQTAGKTIGIKEGANAKMGTATLVGGTVTVNTTAVATGSRIFLSINTSGGTVGAVYVSARVNATSFTITSTSGADTSTVAWLIVDPL